MTLSYSSIAMREILPHSPGYFFHRSSHMRLFISWIMEYMRGIFLRTRSSDQVSSASASTVWLVYAHVAVVIAHASSQLKKFSSTSTLISSGMAIAGWVSFR